MLCVPSKFTVQFHFKQYQTWSSLVHLLRKPLLKYQVIVNEVKVLSHWAKCTGLCLSCAMSRITFIKQNSLIVLKAPSLVLSENSIHFFLDLEFKKYNRSEYNFL